jgi:hypothetical protein
MKSFKEYAQVSENKEFRNMTYTDTKKQLEYIIENHNEESGLRATIKNKSDVSDKDKQSALKELDNFNSALIKALKYYEKVFS